MNKSQVLYEKLQKYHSKKINLSLNRINLALKKLNNIHLKINNPINIIGSDGKFFLVQSLKAFIEADSKKVSTFTSPHLYDFRHRFWLNDRYINLNEIKKELENSKKTFRVNNWPTIDVTRKSVEETAASIIKIYEIKNKK